MSSLITKQQLRGASLWITVKAFKEEDSPVFTACCVSLLEVIEALIRAISYGDVKIVIQGDWRRNERS